MIEQSNIFNNINDDDDGRSYSVNPLLRKIKTYRERMSRRDDNRRRSDGKKYHFPFQQRSKTASPTANCRRQSSTYKKSPKFRRLAANLHIPHYWKRAAISSDKLSEDWTTRSSSLPSRFSYRSSNATTTIHAPSTRALRHCPSSDGFSLTNVERCCNLPRETLLKQRPSYLDFVEQTSSSSSSSTAPNEPNFFVEVASDRVTLSNQTSSKFVVDIGEIKNTIRIVESTTALGGVQEIMKQVLGRRLSAISTKATADKNWMPTAGGEFNSAGNNNYNNNLTSSSVMLFRNRMLNNNQNDPGRLCLKEGRVVLNSGFHSRERYIFLFNDLLLVAKENGVNSYALKDKIKLCELWVCGGKYFDSITDFVKNVQNCFVIGWPTKNYVAEFGNVEERNSWFNLLETRINDEILNCQQKSRTTVASVQYKTRKTSITRKIAINNDQTIDDLLNVALNKFNLNSGDSSPTQYQLWAQFGKDAVHVSLFGYERPLAILKSHIRDILEMDETSDVDFYGFDESSDFGLTFFLKQKRTSKSAKKRTGAGQLVIQLKKRVLHNKHDGVHESANSLTSAGVGKLFGLPLHSLCNDSTVVPKPILDVMEHIFREGIFVEGIFRKPPNCRLLRDIREQLDCGASVTFADVHPTVSASILKEFLRSLPDSLLTSQLLPEWISVVSDRDASTSEKIQKAKNLISRTPACNVQILRYILCIFYHVTTNESLNHMNSHNLSICLGPSFINGAVLAPSTHTVAEDLHTRRSSELVKFLIENFVSLFGVETLKLFGDLPERSPRNSKPDSSEESDSIGVHFRSAATSSLDSLIVDGNSPDGSRPHSIVKNPNATSVNVSHDSGLCDLHASVEDFDDDLLDRSVVVPHRSLSQSDGNSVEIHSKSFNIMSDQMMTKSVDNLSSSSASSSSRKSSTAASSVKSATLDNRSPKRLNDFIMSKSWHYASKNGGNTTSESSDSLYESLESTCSFEPMPIAPIRKSKRVGAESTLVRSPSGERLISIIVNSNPNETTTEETTYDDKKSSLPFVLRCSPDGDVPQTTTNAGNKKKTSTTTVRKMPSPISSFMDRYSAVRKPARHRKGQAPSPPQSKKSSSSLSGTEDTIDEKLNDLSSTPPLIIRCQSSDASVGDELDVETSMKVETNVKTSSLDDSTHRFLQRSSATQILNGLSEISDQVTNAQQKNAFLTTTGGKFNEIINDSSTLTDTSSEERTPHVSREGSRARDCKQVADTLFSKPIERTEISANLRSFSVNAERSLASYRNKPSLSSSSTTVSKRMSHSVIDDELSCLRKNKINSDVHQRRPPSYHEALQQKQQQQTFTTQSLNDKTTKLSILDAIRPPTSLTGLNGMTASLIVPKSSNSFRPRYSTPVAAASFFKEPIQEKARTKEISWSVKEKVNLFDKNNKETSSSNVNNRLSRSRTNVCERLNLDVNRPTSICDPSTKKDSNLMTASCYATTTQPTTNDNKLLSSLVRLSDSHANYPVVRPPPLTTRLSNYSAPLTLRTSKLANNQISTTTGTAYRVNGPLYRPNRSASVHQPLERRHLKPDNESYV